MIKKKTIVLLFLCFIVSAILFIGNYVWETQRLWIQDMILKSAMKMYIPGIYYYHTEKEHQTPLEVILQLTLDSQPILHYMQTHQNEQMNVEDEETIAMILENQANDENAVDAQGNLIGEENQEEVVSADRQQNASINIEELQNFDYLLSRFYLVDSTTTIDESQLNYNDLMSRNMKINQQVDGPKVLIYHTHSQESFVDSIPGDTATSIVGIGTYLTELLNAKGISTIHDEGVYDMIDGKLDRSMAYDYAKESVTQILSENPSIEVVIDLHRDGVGEDTHLVTEVNGKPAAKIMFFNGLSRTTMNGDIGYLYNPYIQDNLSFSFQMQLASETLYPGWARRIYLRAYRYNLHLMPKALLIEAGAQTNTVEEMRNAMELLANTLSCVLIG